MSSGANTSTMKAWQCTEAGKNIEETLFLNNSAAKPRIALADDEVLVKVISASINPVDYKAIEFYMFSKALMIKLPATPGLDYCGTIVSTGTSIDTLVNSSLVFGRLSKPCQFGTLGEYIVVNATGAVPLPTGVDPSQAAAIGTAGLTAYQCISPNVTKGDRIFINGGSGGTGTFGIQIAKVLGCHVTVSCSTANVALCKSLGADEIVNYGTSDVLSKLKTDGQFFSLVVDNVGSPDDLYRESHAFLKPDGIFVQVGAGMNMAAFGQLMSRALTPSFLGGGKRKYQFLQCSNDPAAFRQLGEWMVQGVLKSHIEKIYDFSDVPQAFMKLKTGRAKGKLVIRVSEK